MSESGEAGAEDAGASLLPEWFAPSEKDVICGWARQNHRHPGNQRFRELIEETASAYIAAKTKLEKTQVIAALVERVRNESPGGGFVKRDFHSGRWFEIGDDKARDKTGHAIRRAVEESKKRKGGQSKQAKKSKGRSGSAKGKEISPSTNAQRSSGLEAPPLTMPQKHVAETSSAAAMAALQSYQSQAPTNPIWDPRLFTSQHMQQSMEQLNAASFIEQFMPGGSMTTGNAGYGHANIPNVGRSFAAGNVMQNFGETGPPSGTAGGMAAARASHLASFVGGGGEGSALQYSLPSFATPQEDTSSCTPLVGHSWPPGHRPQSYLDIRRDHQSYRNIDLTFGSAPHDNGGSSHPNTESTRSPGQNPHT